MLAITTSMVLVVAPSAVANDSPERSVWIPGGTISAPSSCPSFEEVLASTGRSSAQLLEDCTGYHGRIDAEAERYVARLVIEGIDGHREQIMEDGDQSCDVAMGYLVEGILSYCESTEAPEVRPDDLTLVIECDTENDEPASPAPQDSSPPVVSRTTDEPKELSLNFGVMGLGGFGEGGKTLGRGVGTGIGVIGRRWRVGVNAAYEQLYQFGHEVDKSPILGHVGAEACVRALRVLEDSPPPGGRWEVSVPVCAGFRAGEIRYWIDEQVHHSYWTGIETSLTFMVKGKAPIAFGLGAELVASLTGDPVKIPGSKAAEEAMAKDAMVENDEVDDDRDISGDESSYFTPGDFAVRVVAYIEYRHRLGGSESRRRSRRERRRMRWSRRHVN